MNRFSLLLEKISQSNQLDFGDILNDIFALFKKTWLQGFLYVLIILIVMVPILSAIYIPFYMSLMDLIQNGGTSPDAANWVTNQGYTFKFLTLGLTGLISLITIPITAGFYGIVHKLDTSQSYDFKDFFYFFKKGYASKIISMVVFSIFVALINLGLTEILPSMLASLSNAIISGVLNIFTMLFVVFMTYNPELDTISIFKLSFNLSVKKFWLILGLLIVTGIIACLGVIACFVGILFTISMIYLPVYLIYKKVIGFNIISDIDRIGTE